ncbi:hypothetical protein [Paenibacillus dendritiformis]|uniref:hypothetical protein n=1 Tax=Paenibacillus dendritiformis TaxID=130049 RepID=UPI000DA8420B|nr:hypothetical protein [Paenibacillus dendritiformis]PZM63475.1 hypothetical protein DOE73_21790 [Paenibacillus dendritiformis]
MKSINQLVQEAHQNAVNKGWWEEPRTYGELIALVHSEVSEALEDYRVGRKPAEVWYEKKDNYKKPCGIPSELADVCIRIFDIAGKYGWGRKLHKEVKELSEIPTQERWKQTPFGGKLACIHMDLSSSLLEFDFNDRKQAVYYLGEAIVTVEKIAKEYGIDLERAIAEKMAYNATRPRRHGGKVL